MADLWFNRSLPRAYEKTLSDHGLRLAVTRVFFLALAGLI